MKIKIKDKEIELRYTIRTNILYESIEQSQVDYTALDKVTVIATLLYANILATMQANKMEVKLTYDEYMNWLDENKGVVILNEYAVWLAAQMQTQFELIPDDESKKKPRKTAPRKMKKD